MNSIYGRQSVRVVDGLVEIYDTVRLGSPSIGRPSAVSAAGLTMQADSIIPWDLEMLRLFLPLLLLLLSSPQTWALSVTFINPGRSDEAFWLSASQAMQAAAKSLDVQLEVLYAQRQPEQTLQLAREVAARLPARRPDYVILVNEKGMLVSAAQVLGAAGIPSFAAFSGLLPQERGPWAPRRGLPLLLGSLQARAHEAGYLTAKALIHQGLRRKLQAADGKLHLLAIAGDRSTPSSIERNEGLRKALDEHPEVELDQQVFANWRRDKATEQMQGLLQRNPHARLVWSGSDQMAFGAMTAVEQQGRQPGRDLLFSGINTSNEAMQSVLDGRLSALAGGHFMTGAWALLMLYDHHHGRDFIDEGLELEPPLFMQFSKADARRFLTRFGQGLPELNFRVHSKHLNPQLKRYRFGLDDLLR